MSSRQLISGESPPCTHRNCWLSRAARGRQSKASIQASYTRSEYLILPAANTWQQHKMWLMSVAHPTQKKEKTPDWHWVEHTQSPLSASNCTHRREPPEYNSLYLIILMQKKKNPRFVSLSKSTPKVNGVYSGPRPVLHPSFMEIH